MGVWYGAFFSFSHVPYLSKFTTSFDRSREMEEYCYTIMLADSVPRNDAAYFSVLYRVESYVNQWH